MDVNDQNALLEQLAESSRRTADSLETLNAEMVSLRAHVSEVDTRVSELQSMQHDAAERIERLSSEVDRLRGDRSLGAQIEALGASQTDAQAQLERLEGQMRRLDRVETSMAQMQSEVSKQIEDRERALRGEIAAQVRQRVEDQAGVAREMRVLGSRVESALAQQNQLDGLAQGREALQAEAQALGLRIDALDAAGASLEEMLRREGQMQSSRATGFETRLAEIEGVVSDWQERIERQLETVREAQGIAQQMQTEAERMRRESHAAAEAWRVAEGRVDETMGSIRADMVDRLDRVSAERRNDWEVHQRQHEVEQRGQREARETAVTELEAAIEALSESLQAGLEITGRDLAEIKHRLGTYFRSLREQVSETADAFEVQLPSDDPTAGDPERRQALRRALRARRAARGG